MLLKHVVPNVGTFIVLPKVERQVHGTGLFVAAHQPTSCPVKITSYGALEVLGEPADWTLPLWKLAYAEYRSLQPDVCCIPGWVGLDPVNDVFEIKLPSGTLHLHFEGSTLSATLTLGRAQSTWKHPQQPELDQAPKILGTVNQAAMQLSRDIQAALRGQHTGVTVHVTAFLAYRNAVLNAQRARVVAPSAA